MEANAYQGLRAHGKLPAMRLGALCAAVCAFGAACGDDGGPDIVLPGELVEELRALPGVASAEVMPTQTAGYSYFVLQFEQPVDHDDPQSPTFLQKVALLHKDIDAPMVEYTTGYWEYYGDRTVELTTLLGANQISIEHRFFDGSRPEPADWSKLTIAQMAHDQHKITTSLRTLYTGAFITSGASKGGMTASYYRRFYPDDVEGTVPYVAPLSFGAPDTRYAAFLDTLGPETCRNAVRAAATEMLANRWSDFLMRAQQQQAATGDQYTRIALAPALESSIFNLEWSFWQYYGVNFCDDVPATSASNDELWDFLEDISPVSDNTDERIAQFDAYYYQSYHQLGYPDGGAAYLDPYLQFTDADYENVLPTAVPAYDGGAAMNDIDGWIQSEASRFIFIYGQWDPWTGGAYQLGNASDSLHLTQAQGTHGAAIRRLTTSDMTAVFDKLEAWTGVRPQVPTPGSAQGQIESALSVDIKPPRIPPAVIRGLSRRRLSP